MGDSRQTERNSQTGSIDEAQSPPGNFIVAVSRRLKSSGSGARYGQTGLPNQSRFLRYQGSAISPAGSANVSTRTAAPLHPNLDRERKPSHSIHSPSVAAVNRAKYLVPS